MRPPGGPARLRPLALLVALLAAAPAAAQPPASLAVNMPLDLDGDGAADTAVVAGDWDGDGAVETEDVQYAVNALRGESGPKQLWILAGDYLPPPGNEVGTGTGYGGRPQGNGDNTGQVLIDSDHWLIECKDGASLLGIDFDSQTTSNLAVSPIEVKGARDVTLRGCHFHGGFPEGHGPARVGAGGATTLVDAGAAWVPGEWVGSWVVVRPGEETELLAEIVANDATSLGVASWPGPPPAAGDWYSIGFDGGDPIYSNGFARMAIEILNSQDVTVEDCVASHSGHTALYAKNTDGLAIRRCRLHHAGGYANVGGGLSRWPFIYLFNGVTTTPRTMRGMVVEDVECRFGGGACLNLRWDPWTGGLALADLQVSGLQARDLVNLRRLRGTGINLSGVDGAQIHDNRIEDGAAGIVLQGDGANLGYYGQPQRNRNVQVVANRVESLVYDPVASPSPVGIFVMSHNENVLVSDNSVSGIGVPDDGVVGRSAGDCLSVAFPSRQVSLFGNALHRCGGAGLIQSGNVGGAADETLLVDGIDIQGVDYYNRADALTRSGVELTHDVNGVVITDFSIGDFTASAIRHAAGALQGSLLANGRVHGLAGFLGNRTEKQSRNLPCTDADWNEWVLTTDALSADDCTFAAGRDSQQALCVCQGAQRGWQKLVIDLHAGIRLWDARASGNRVDQVECQGLLRGVCVDQAPGGGVNLYRSIGARNGPSLLGMQAAIDCNGGFCDVGDGSTLRCDPAIATCLRENDGADAGDCDLLQQGTRRVITNDTAMGRCADQNDDGVLDGGGSSTSSCICSITGRWVSEPKLGRFSWVALSGLQSAPLWSGPAASGGPAWSAEGGNAIGHNRIWVPPGERWTLRQLAVTVVEPAGSDCAYRLVAGGPGQAPGDAGVEVAASRVQTGPASGVQAVGAQAVSPIFSVALGGGSWFAVEAGPAGAGSCDDPDVQLSVLYEAR